MNIELTLICYQKNAFLVRWELLFCVQNCYCSRWRSACRCFRLPPANCRMRTQRRRSSWSLVKVARLRGWGREGTARAGPVHFQHPPGLTRLLSLPGKGFFSPHPTPILTDGPESSHSHTCTEIEPKEIKIKANDWQTSKASSVLTFLQPSLPLCERCSNKEKRVLGNPRSWDLQDCEYPAILWSGADPISSYCFCKNKTP